MRSWEIIIAVRWFGVDSTYVKLKPPPHFTSQLRQDASYFESQKEDRITSLSRQFDRLAEAWDISRLHHTPLSFIKKIHDESLRIIPRENRPEALRSWSAEVHQISPLCPRDLGSKDLFWTQFSSARHTILSSISTQLEKIPGTPEYQKKQAEIEKKRLETEKKYAEANQKRIEAERVREEVETKRVDAIKKELAPFVAILSQFDRLSSQWGINTCWFPIYRGSQFTATEYRRGFSDYLKELKEIGLKAIKAQQDPTILNQWQTECDQLTAFRPEGLSKENDFWTQYTTLKSSFSRTVKDQLEYIPGTPQYLQRIKDEREHEQWKKEHEARRLAHYIQHDRPRDLKPLLVEAEEIKQSQDLTDSYRSSGDFKADLWYRYCSETKTLIQKIKGNDISVETAKAAIQGLKKMGDICDRQERDHFERRRCEESAQQDRDYWGSYFTQQYAAEAAANASQKQYADNVRQRDYIAEALRHPESTLYTGADLLKAQSKLDAW